MKKQGMGGSAFFVGVGWLGLSAGVPLCGNKKF